MLVEMEINMEINEKKEQKGMNNPTSFERGEIIHLINVLFGRYIRKNNVDEKINAPWLILLDGNKAIFKSEHKHEQKHRDFFNSVMNEMWRFNNRTETKISLKTVKCSGTIKKLKGKITNIS